MASRASVNSAGLAACPPGSTPNWRLGTGPLTPGFMVKVILIFEATSSSTVFQLRPMAPCTACSSRRTASWASTAVARLTMTTGRLPVRTCPAAMSMTAVFPIRRSPYMTSFAPGVSKTWRSRASSALRSANWAAAGRVVTWKGLAGRTTAGSLVDSPVGDTLAGESLGGEREATAESVLGQAWKLTRRRGAAGLSCEARWPENSPPGVHAKTRRDNGSREGCPNRRCRVSPIPAQLGVSGVHGHIHQPGRTR